MTAEWEAKPTHAQRHGLGVRRPSATLDTLRRFIADAPRTAPPGPSGLIAWETGPEAVTICNSCAGRIMARNCTLPTPTVPVWDGDIFPAPTCALESYHPNA